MNDVLFEWCRVRYRSIHKKMRNKNCDVTKFECFVWMRYDDLTRTTESTFCSSVCSPFHRRFFWSSCSQVIVCEGLCRIRFPGPLFDRIWLIILNWLVWRRRSDRLTELTDCDPWQSKSPSNVVRNCNNVTTTVTVGPKNETVLQSQRWYINVNQSKSTLMSNH